jgi:peptidoglycan hydrolase-like protein with peptidoglycan-binding domain
MASRLVTTSFAIVSMAGLLAGCDTVSNWFGGHNSSESSGSTGSSYSTGSGTPTQSSYNQGTDDPRGTSQSSNAAIDSYASGGYDSSATAKSRMSSRSGERVSSDKVKHAQQALKDEGLYQGSIDGIVGPQTRDAVSRYQHDHNLKTTAMLDRQTLRSLDQTQSSGTVNSGNATSRANSSNADTPNSTK